MFNLKWLRAVTCCLVLTFLILSCGKTEDSAMPAPGPSTGDTGLVSFQYLGKQVTYKTVRANDGNIWLQQNVGSSRVATAINDTASYGDFFQWGRWDDGHQIRKPTPKMGNISMLSANNPGSLKNASNPLYFSGWWNQGKASDQWTAKTPAEASATNGCDPCQLIGTGWRLPTDAEWTALATSERITNSATAFTSSLKIPTGGWRSFTDASVLRNEGLDSWFWSSTASDKTPTYGLGIWIKSGSILTSYPDVRAYGTSMRCIKK